MIEAHTNDALIGGPVGSGHAAPGVVAWLGLAAAPTFALMAAWTSLFSGQSDMLCMAMQEASPLNGMALMYALMTLFHVAPWLKLMSSRQICVRRS